MRKAKTVRKENILQLDYEFTLPKGYIDGKGEVHREGVMRLATAADELLPMSDPRVKKNPEYHNILLLSRVVTKLGDIVEVTPKVMEGLFVADLSYLLRMYREINDRDEDDDCGDGSCHH